MAKPKLALYWAASCGGCEIAVVRIYEKILDVASFFEIVLWPCLMDFKYKDVDELPDQGIDLCLFNGAVRNSEQEEIAKMLREKSKVMVAFGACAHLGGIPGLANATTREAILDRAYRETPSTINPDGVFPLTSYAAPEGELTLPAFHNTVRSLQQVVPVDYFVPGCPPVKEQVEAVLQAVMEGNLPPAGSVVGATLKTVCDQCPRVKEDKKIKAFRRPYEFVPDPERCLLEQGLLCAGPATRGGCGSPCLSANMPCRGCYGPPPGVVDQGAKLLSAVASIVDSDDPEEIERIMAGIPDTIASFYMFGLAASLLHRRRLDEHQEPEREPAQAAAG